MLRLIQLARAAVTVMALVALTSASGCGLFQHEEPIGFRSYKLEGVGYAEAAEIVHEVTRKEANLLFGGVTLTWDEALGNLQLEPIYQGQRRLRLYIHLAPSGPDVSVEMFALVDYLSISGTQIGFGEPMQDVPLEENLFKAYVTELSRRRDEGG